MITYINNVSVDPSITWTKFITTSHPSMIRSCNELVAVHAMAGELWNPAVNKTG